MLLPFLTSYDPPGTSEGSIDPLGLYRIADQLAVKLVPAVRERMQRIRFLTAMAVGALVTEGIEDDPSLRDASPCLVWEWLIVESLTRKKGADPDIWGVPGTLVGSRAVNHQHGYLDARSYLKTPRIFGFNGVYKRLGIHLGLVDVHLGPGPNTEALVNAWARGRGFTGLKEARPMISRWADAIRRSLAENPPRTKPGWGSQGWIKVAEAFVPGQAAARERKYLRRLLLSADGQSLGALPMIWELQTEFDDGFQEKSLHHRLEEHAPAYRTLLEAIRSYEAFARALHDSFDILLAEGSRSDGQGFAVTRVAADVDFVRSVDNVQKRYEAAHHALGEIQVSSLSLQNLFDSRFRRFARPMDAGDVAHALCEHHQEIQRGKSADGKRPWFDHVGPDRIYVRHAYRAERREIAPGEYVHGYRGEPIRQFHMDLS